MAEWAGATLALDDFTLTKSEPWPGATLAIDDNTRPALPKPWRGATLAIDDNTSSQPTTWRGATLAIDDNAIDDNNPTRLKVWDGTQWVVKPYYVWDGSGWKQVT